MALDAKRYFNNAVVGIPQVGADVDVTETHATPRFAVGTHFNRSDGNRYVYAYTDAAVAAGSVVAPVFANSGFATFDNAVILPASATAVPAEAPIQAGSVGSHFVQLTKASVTANQLAGGYFITEDGSGKGFAYRIRGNTATGGPATGDVLIQLYERIKVVLSPNTDVTIVPSPWNAVDVCSAATNWAAAGVMCAATTTALPYGWVCTHGTVAALQQGTITGGDQVALSTATSGAVSSYGAGSTDVSTLTGVQILGYAIQAGANAEFATIFLQLE